MAGDGAIEWVGIDIQLADLDKGIDFTRTRSTSRFCACESQERAEDDRWIPFCIWFGIS
jgi:hypothetical protein